MRYITVIFLFLSSLAFAQNDASLTTQNNNTIYGTKFYPKNYGDMFQGIINSKASIYGSYSNPSWITSLAWSKITGAPTTYSWSSITGTPTTLSGYGITNGVPTSRTLTINGTTYDLSADRSWTISSSLPADADGVLQDASGVKSWGNVKNIYTGAGSNNGAIPYWNGVNYSYTAVGSNGNVFMSVGGGAPVPTDPKSMNGSWTNVTLTGGWSVVSGSTVQWRYNLAGRVELRGRIDSTGTSSSVVTGSSAVPVPVDANGVAVVKIPIVNETDVAFAYVQISSLGVISILPYNAGKIYTLNGVSYLAAY